MKNNSTFNLMILIKLYVDKFYFSGSLDECPKSTLDPEQWLGANF